MSKRSASLCSGPVLFSEPSERRVSTNSPIAQPTSNDTRTGATSAGLEIVVVAVSDVKAHVLLRNCERVRTDGTLIEEVSASYAFTKTANGSKIFAMSSIEFPATP
jgi:hypothetical protein